MSFRPQRFRHARAAGKSDYLGGALGAACHKTKLCQFYMQGLCSKSSDCNYAHGAEELRAMPNLSRTKLCPALLKSGRCDAGDLCKYAHQEVELQDMQEVPRLPQAPLQLPINSRCSWEMRAAWVHAAPDDVGLYNMMPTSTPMAANPTINGVLTNQTDVVSDVSSAFNGTVPEAWLWPCSWSSGSLLWGAVVPVQDCPAREHIMAGSTALLPADTSAEGGCEAADTSKCVAQVTESSEGSTAGDDDDAVSSSSSNSFYGSFSDIKAATCHYSTDERPDDSSDVELTIYRTFFHLRPLKYNEPPRRSRSVPCSRC